MGLHTFIGQYPLYGREKHTGIVAGAYRFDKRTHCLARKSSEFNH